MHVTNVAFEGHISRPQLPTLKLRFSSLVKQTFAASEPQGKRICGFLMLREEAATCLIRRAANVPASHRLTSVPRPSVQLRHRALQRTSRNGKSRQTNSVFEAN